jgi:hypothetical protein
MKHLFISVLLALAIGMTGFVIAKDAHSKDLIPYKILKRQELSTIKLSLDVEVPLVQGRLPNENEIAALSNYLVSKERKHQRSFVMIYLPDMEVGAGAFATASHNPNLKVNIMKFMLFRYPQYKKFAN